MSAQATLQKVQELCGQPEEQRDGVPGPVSTAAYEALCAAARAERMEAKQRAALHAEEPQEHPPGEWHTVKASSFADAADVRGFRRCKQQGNSDQFCFGKGDNGIGFAGHPWQTDCTDESIPYVALPPEDWAPKWGASSAAVHQKVAVTIGGKTIVCELGDTMPHRANIHNGAGIDLAQGAQKAFGLNAPFMVDAQWSWA